jgi:hypothetical protein
MAAKNLVTESITLWVGYSYTEGVPGVLATAQFCRPTNRCAEEIPAISVLFRRTTNPTYVIRPIGITCNSVTEDTGILQLNMFEEVSKQIREKVLMEAFLGSGLSTTSVPSRRE